MVAKQTNGFGGAAVATAGILGGAFAVAAATTAVFGGVAALIASIIQEDDAHYLEEQVGQGHPLLFVRTSTKGQEKLALDILNRNSAFNPRIYSVSVPS